MSPDDVSVFDLSPAEKLQLVEDLWDDLAANPTAVPVHDWQKEELSRRKANLMNNPAAALSWEEVVTVFGVFHTARDPAKWRQRLL
jgi:putative addiction module component (TIGR02574 family)